jgi:hypothetical protein
MEREVFCECFIRTIEEVVVGYIVDINSSMFDDKLRKHSQEPSGSGDGVISCKTLDERSYVKSRKVLSASLNFWAEWLVQFVWYFGVRRLVFRPRY